MKPYKEFRAEMIEKLSQDETIAAGEKPLRALPPDILKKIPMLALYGLSKDALKLQKDLAGIVEKRKPHTVPTLHVYGRVDKAISQAQRYTKKARELYKVLPRPRKIRPWLSLLDEAGSALHKAKRNIEIGIGVMVMDLPKQTTPEFEKYHDDLQEERYSSDEAKWVKAEARDWSYPWELNHERSRAAEHWVIISAAYTLKTSLTVKKRLTVTNRQRNQIIRALLKIGLGQTFQVEAINTVLYSHRRKHGTIL